MGTKPPIYQEVGLRVPKLGGASDNSKSQKSMSRQRFSKMVCGTFKFAYPEEECSYKNMNSKSSDCLDFATRCKKAVEMERILPAFNQNKFEK
jgi:hypothetical protein